MELSQEGVQQHIALLNLQANWGKHRQVQEVQKSLMELSEEGVNWPANWGKQVQEVWKCPIELSELGVESYDNLGSPKLSGYVHSVAPHFEHVLELLGVFDP